MTRKGILRAVVVACALISVLPAHALASHTEQSLLMDDNQLIYASPQSVAINLQRIASLGVDRVKVSVVWYIVSPDPTSTTRPNFDASNPADYAPGAWDRYDLIVRLAQLLHMQVYFQITPPSPAWAVAHHGTRQGYAWSYLPNARLYAQFVHAIGERYSGTYVPPSSTGATSSQTATIASLVKNPDSISTPLPRVSYWGIWNEPNEAAWLNPQFKTVHGHEILTAPSEYRGLVDAAWSSLAATGHARDTVMVGETASRGWILPTPFIEALYCVGPNLRPLTGRSATEIRCPKSGNRAAFVKAHPGLFRSSGYAHHPYSFDLPPTAQPQPSGAIGISNLGGFERTLKRIFSAYGQRRAGGVPLYLTEFGYKTNPPNPFVHTSWQQQAKWLNQAEYMTYKLPYVRALAQFLLYDDGPNKAFPPGSRGYWGTYQSGLLTMQGQVKPAYGAFRIPIWLPSTRHGSRVTVWGQLRPADHSQLQYGVLEFRRKGSHTWKSLREIRTSNSEGFLLAHVAIPSAGSLRLEWLDPHGGAAYTSRTVTIS